MLYITYYICSESEIYITSIYIAYMLYTLKMVIILTFLSVLSSSLFPLIRPAAPSRFCSSNHLLCCILEVCISLIRLIRCFSYDLFVCCISRRRRAASCLRSKACIQMYHTTIYTHMYLINIRTLISIYKQKEKLKVCTVNSCILYITLVECSIICQYIYVHI